MNKMSARDAYDAVACQYDSAFHSNVSIAEDLAVYNMLGFYLQEGLTIDLGCGTGALLEHLSFKKENYIGIDISENMIKCAKAKFPHNYFNCLDMQTFTHLIAADAVQNVVSLFGAISYVDPSIYQEIYRILRPGGFFFLMLFNERYRDRTSYILRKNNIDCAFHTYRQVKHLLPQHEVTGLNFEGDLLKHVPFDLLAVKYTIEMFSVGKLIPTRAYFSIVVGEKVA